MFLVAFPSEILGFDVMVTLSDSTSHCTECTIPINSSQGKSELCREEDDLKPTPGAPQGLLHPQCLSAASVLSHREQQ